MLSDMVMLTEGCFYCLHLEPVCRNMNKRIHGAKKLAEFPYLEIRIALYLFWKCLIIRARKDLQVKLVQPERKVTRVMLVLLAHLEQLGQTEIRLVFRIMEKTLRQKIRQHGISSITLSPNLWTAKVYLRHSVLLSLHGTLNSWKPFMEPSYVFNIGVWHIYNILSTSNANGAEMASLKYTTSLFAA